MYIHTQRDRYIRMSKTTKPKGVLYKTTWVLYKTPIPYVQNAIGIVQNDMGIVQNDKQKNNTRIIQEYN